MPPPPPATPSPHRFVIKKQAPPRKTPLTQEHTPRPSTQQFNATPRFQFSSTPRPSSTQLVHGFIPSASRYQTPGNKIHSEQDAIGPSSDDFPEEGHDSIEADEQDGRRSGIDDEVGGVEDSYDFDTRTIKRRRLSQPSDEVGNEDDEELLLNDPDLHDSPSSSLPILSSPPTPRRPLSMTAPRFIFSTPAPLSTPHAPQSQQPTFLKPPRFRPPDPSQQPQTQFDPLPEQFSPHRKGQKYLTGGLAAEVRDWLVNVESAIPAKTAAGGSNKADPWGLKIVVDEVRGGHSGSGMALVSGRQVLEDGMIDYLGVVRIILAGEGAGVGLQRGSNVEVGRTVCVKGVIWEVAIDGERWVVGVDWKVL